MSDACCGGDTTPIDDAPGRLIDVPALRRAAIAGIAFVSGLVLAAAGVGAGADALFVVAVIVGGSTFVPESLEGLLKERRLGVGLLVGAAVNAPRGGGRYVEPTWRQVMRSLARGGARPSGFRSCGWRVDRWPQLGQPFRLANKNHAVAPDL